MFSHNSQNTSDSVEHWHWNNAIEGIYKSIDKLNETATKKIFDRCQTLTLTFLRSKTFEDKQSVKDISYIKNERSFLLSFSPKIKLNIVVISISKLFTPI